MKKMTDRGWWMLAMTAAMIVLQLRFPSQATAAWLPMAVALAAAALYWDELRTYHWNAWKKAALWKEAFRALTHGLIAQAIGIGAVVYGFGVNMPAAPLAVTPAVIVSAVVCSAALEELVYRKIVFGRLNRYAGFWGAATASSLLFALAHFNYAAYLGYFLLGVVWCRAYRRTGDAGVVIVAHLLFNLLYFILSPWRG